MSIIKSQNARVMSEEAIQYLCKCINLVNSSPTSLIDNLHLADNLTFSSTRINTLLTTLKEDCNKYTNSIIANLSRLELRVITDEADMIEHNKLYLIKKNGETSYSQYVIVTNDSGVNEKILLGTCDISMTDYLKISDADSTYCKKTDFNLLNTEVDKVKTTLGNENLNTTKQTLTGGVNELKTDLTTHTNDTDIHITSAERDKWNNGANGEDIIKKTDIKTTLDKDSTHTDICSGKAIFDAIQANAIGKETVLYEGNISDVGTYTLTDDVNNYDFIVINHTSTGSSPRCQSITLTKTEVSKCINSNNRFICVLGAGSDNSNISGHFNGNKIIIDNYTSENITSITGYKFGQVTVQNTITNPSQGKSYSTDEQLTGGTWIDGKPIYRKVIEFTSAYPAVSIPNIEHLIGRGGYITTESSSPYNILPFPWSQGASDCSDIYLFQGKTLRWVSAGILLHPTKKSCVCLEYTKKTD